MSLHRRAAKRDKSEPEIIRALRAIGASVQQISARDFPDLVVGYRGRNFLLEVKTGKGKLQEGQEEFAASWRGSSAVVRTPDEAIAIVTKID